MRDQPTSFPTKQADGSPLKPITRVVLDRRATSRFQAEEVPERFLEAILEDLPSPVGIAEPYRVDILPPRGYVIAR